MNRSIFTKHKELNKEAEPSRTNATTVEAPPHLANGKKAALALLLEAHDDAEDAHRDIWAYAVAVKELRLAGATDSSLRWLFDKGYVDYLGKKTQILENRGDAARVVMLNFASSLRAVLTKQGLTFARQVCTRSDIHSMDSSERRKFTIILCGERQKGHFHILVQCKKVTLTLMALRALIALILARGSRAAGYFPQNRVTIRRLRQAFALAVGNATVKLLIQTGFGEEYRLNIPLQHIAIDPSFFELEDLRVISPDQMKQLRGLCVNLQSSQRA